MVTVVQSSNRWGKLGQALGEGATKGYQSSSDQKALKKAIEDLGPNASGEDIVKAITRVNVYDPESKKQMIEGYVGLEKVKTEKAKIEAKQKKDQEKVEAESREVKALYKASHHEATDEEIETNTKDLKPADVRSLIYKPENVTDYEIAKNKAKPQEDIVKNTYETGQKAQKLVLPTEAAIINNEKYETGERYWDAAVDLADNKFVSLLKSNTGQQLEAYTPIAVASFSDKMSGVLSVKKINLIEKKAVSPVKDKETNRLFLYMDYYDRKLDMLKDQFTREIINESKYGLAPTDLDEKIRKKMLPYQEQIDRDVGRLLNGKKPVEKISELGITKKKKQAAPEGQVFVISPEGQEGYLDINLIGKPGYEGFKEL